MRGMMIVIVIVAAASLAGCATGPTSFPVQATRYHYDAMTDRGSIGIAPLAADATAGIEYQTYAAAVQAELLRLGYTMPAQGTKAKYLATVGFSRTSRPLPPRRSPVTIGVGGGGGGGYGGGVGVGGGISFPVGGSGAREGLVTELSVRIMNGPDAVWEGQAQSLTLAGAPDADAGPVAARLASALFSGFPGDSGRTITVK